MNPKAWFAKFALLKKGDVVCFDGVIRLRVECVMTYGGAKFQTGEIIPARSPLWESATIEGKQVLWTELEDEEENEPADWWKK